MGIGMDVVEPHPDAKYAACCRKIEEAGLDRLSSPVALGVFEIDAIGAGIL